MRVLDWINPELYKEVWNDLKEGKVVSAVKKYAQTVPMTIAIQKAAPFAIGQVSKIVVTAYPSAAAEVASIGKGLNAGIQAAGDLWLLPAKAVGKTTGSGAVNIGKAAAQSVTKGAAITAGKLIAAGAIVYGGDRLRSKLFNKAPDTHVMFGMVTGKFSEKDKEKIQNTELTVKSFLSGAWQMSVMAKTVRPSLKKKSSKKTEKKENTTKNRNSKNDK